MAARQRRLGGTVIDGLCRDVGEHAAIGYGVYGRSVTMVSPNGRLVATAINEPVEFAGVRVRSGDLVLADSSGVVVVPHEAAHDVVNFARELRWPRRASFTS